MLQRAGAAIVKRGLHVPRAKLFIRLSVVQAMADVAASSCALVVPFLLFLSAYTFMLRLPSVALPVVAHAYGPAHAGDAPMVQLTKDYVAWIFPRRKNWDRPSIIKRQCWCHQCVKTCPVHVLGAALRAIPPGIQPFAGITRDRALRYLRRFLDRIGVDQPDDYGTQDLRRGHNEDLVRAGKTWQEILLAGGWRAPGGNRPYTDLSELEMTACMRAHLDIMEEED